jgi:hypothetical protein
MSARSIKNPSEPTTCKTIWPPWIIRQAATGMQFNLAVDGVNIDLRGK